ncbi:MAG TPA: MarR family transcriptional regulator [Dehalococcoidales bacterium]|nr:MarR family transcriptional regulator [Dehalococcoidales bacterium]
MTQGEEKKLPAREIWSILDRTGFAISRLRELELLKYGLTIEQSSVLYILTNTREGSITPGELENITMRQHHSISVLTSGMAASGLVKKVKHLDGKRLKIELTPKGREHYLQTTITSLEESFSALSEKEWLILSTFFTGLLLKSRRMLNLATDLSTKIADENTNLRQGLHIHELWTLLDRTRFAISRLRSLELAHFGLTIEQSSILHMISNRETTTVKDMEDLTMRRQHSISSLLKGTIKMGIVTRVRENKEKRFRIELTQYGKHLYQSLTVNSLEEIFSVLSPLEKEKMTELLKRLLGRARYLLGMAYQPPFFQPDAGGINAPGNKTQ